MFDAFLVKEGGYGSFSGVRMRMLRLCRFQRCINCTAGEPVDILGFAIASDSFIHEKKANSWYSDKNLLGGGFQFKVRALVNETHVTTYACTENETYIKRATDNLTKSSRNGTFDVLPLVLETAVLLLNCSWRSIILADFRPFQP